MQTSDDWDGCNKYLDVERNVVDLRSWKHSHTDASLSLPVVTCVTMPSSKSRSLRELAFGITKRNSTPGPPSPTFSEATNPSALHFGPGGPEKIITRTNLKTSVQSLEDVRLNCSACFQGHPKQLLSS